MLFFSAPIANFVRSFNLDKVYRRTIPCVWHYFRYLSFPEMTSNWNLNVKNTFKFQFQNLSLTKMLQTSSGSFFPCTVLLFESGWDILLYESLKLENSLKLMLFFRFSIQFLVKFRKNQFFKIFHFFNFFRLRCAIFVRIFDLDKTHNCIIPSG